MKEPDIEIWMDRENEDDLLLDLWDLDDGPEKNTPSSDGADYSDSRLSDVLAGNAK